MRNNSTNTAANDKRNTIFICSSFSSLKKKTAPNLGAAPAARCVIVNAAIL